MMSSHQIGAMAMQQQAMFGNFQSYATQITPPYGAGPGMGAGAPAPMGGPMGGYQVGPPPMMPPPPPPMPGFSPQYGGGMMNMAMMAPYASPQMGLGPVMGEQMAGNAFGALSSFGRGAATVGQIGTMAAGGLSMLGIGGVGMGMAAGLPGMAVVGGLEAGAWAAGQLHTGFQQRQGVNRVLRQRFGGQMGVGQGRGGTGFSTDEMGQISTMVRGMASEDMFTSFEELTRVMDRTAQMGLYRGVNSAREFKQKFQQTVDTLKEVAQAMHTSLEGASEFMQQQRNMGFFSGQDISRSLMRTRMNAGASGISMQQMQQIGMQGTQMGRMMGMRGRTGAQAMMEGATNIGVGMQMGVFSDEMIAEATGGLTGAEGAQAASARMMQINQRWMRQGAGRVMLAALYDPESGGINRERMQRAMAGGYSFQQLRSMGRANIASQGGRRSEFFRDEERLRGELMSQGGAPVMMGMISQHFGNRRGLDMDDPIMQRWMRRRFGMSQSEVELFVRQQQEMPRIMAERRVRMRSQLEQEARGRAREGRGFSGFRRRWSHWWEKEVENPIRQAADDVTTNWSNAIDSLFMEMEGVVKTHIQQRTKDAVSEFVRTDKTSPGGVLMSGAEFRAYDKAFRAKNPLQFENEGNQSWLGRVGEYFGMRGKSPRERARQIKLFRERGYGKIKGDEQVVQELNRAMGSLGQSAADLGWGGEDLTRMQLETKRLVMEKRFGYGQNQDETLRDWYSLRKQDPIRAAEQQIDFLSRQSPEIARAFEKVGDDPYERAALLRAFEGELAGTSYSSGVEAVATGLSSEDLAARLEQVKKRRSDILSGLSVKLKRKRKLSGWERAILSIGSAGRGGRGGVPGSADMANMAASGYTYHNVNLRKMVGNEKLNDLMRTAVMSEDPQARADAISSMRMMGNKDSGSTGIPGVEQQDVLDVAAELHDRNSESSKQLRELYENENYEQNLLLNTRQQELGRDLQKYSNRYRRDIEEALKDEPGMQAAYDALIERRSKGTFTEAQQAEEEFLARYGHTEAAKNLMGVLQREEGGAGSFLGYGLELASGYARGLGKGKRREKRLLERHLKEMGIEGGLGEIFGGGWKGRRELNQLLGQIRSGDAGATEELLNRIRSKGALGQVGDVGRFRRETEELLKVMKGNTTDEELQGIAAERASEAAESARLQGATPERQRSMTELAQKQVDYLGQVVKLSKLQLTAASENRPATAEEIAAAVGKNGGGSDNARGTATPGANSTGAGGGTR